MDTAAQLVSRTTLNKTFKLLRLDNPVTTSSQGADDSVGIIKRMEYESSHAGGWGHSRKCVCSSKCLRAAPSVPPQRLQRFS